MLEHARTLFMEEWAVTVLALLGLFALGYCIARLLRRRPKRSNAASRATSRAAGSGSAAGQQHGAGRQHAGDADGQQPGLDRIQRAMEAALDAEPAQQAHPPSPDPGGDVPAMVEEGLKGLDSFGLTFQKMRVFNDPNASLQQISQAITSDLVFSAKVLKTANSPFFGAPGAVSSLHHAVLVLGLTNLKTLYFQDHFRMIGQETGRMAQLREDVWRHSITTAICASYLCKAFRLVPPETAFTLGLLHDLGKLVLADMVEQLEARGEDLLDFSPGWGVAEEQRRLGVDHAWIGREAAVKWNMPREVAMVIGAHHSLLMDATPPPSDAAKAQMVTLVLANHLAHALLEPEAPAPPMPEALAQRLHNRQRLVQLVRDPKLLEELQMARVLP